MEQTYATDVYNSTKEWTHCHTQILVKVMSGDTTALKTKLLCCLKGKMSRSATMETVIVTFRPFPLCPQYSVSLMEGYTSASLERSLFNLQCFTENYWAVSPEFESVCVHMAEDNVRAHVFRKWTHFHFPGIYFTSHTQRSVKEEVKNKCHLEKSFKSRLLLTQCEKSVQCSESWGGHLAVPTCPPAPRAGSGRGRVARGPPAGAGW